MRHSAQQIAMVDLCIMMHKEHALLARLRALGLSADEAKLYIELLQEPLTHLQLSRKTGLERTRVYRLVSSLEQRSLITRKTDDTGTLLVAADPSALEVELIVREERLKEQRSIFDDILPALENLQRKGESLFTIKTYAGREGMRQMVWNDLRTRGELLVLGGGLLEEMTGSHRWSERYRAQVAERNLRVRILANSPEEDVPTSTKVSAYLKRYMWRSIPKKIANIDANQITIYDDTVAVYHWRDDQKVGLEVVSSTYAQTMRQLFEILWNLASFQNISREDATCGVSA